MRLILAIGLYAREGQLDGFRDPHFSRRHRLEACVYWSSQPYGSNTAHCL